jgi:hypothetical protein
MHPTDAAEESGGPEVEARLLDLEQEMTTLCQRHTATFELANAWAERYDAIIALVPEEQRASVEARLSRIGIRWGMMPGSRVTVEFRVSDVTALARTRRRPRKS